MQAGIQAWTDALLGTKRDVDHAMDTDAPAQPTHKPGGDPQIQTMIHEVKTLKSLNNVLHVILFLVG